jgi:hypothetical protein
MARNLATSRHRKPFGELEQFKVKPRHRTSGHNPKAQGEFEATLAAERREAEARAATAERKRDEAPAPRGPRARARGPRHIGVVKLPRTLGRVRRQIARNPKGVLIAELLAVVSIVTVSRLADGEVPAPSDYLAPFVVYLVLSFGAEFGGPGTARLAAAFGALILVAVVVANVDGLVRVFQAVSFGPGEGPTTFAAQGLSGFKRGTGQAGQGQGGGGGGSF